jgi:superfamily I DNA/RNA helicase
MQPDQNQRAAAHADPERPLVVIAGPGSAKTRLPTKRIALLLAYQRAGGLPPGSIVTLTLTTLVRATKTRAAVEMRSHMRRSLSCRSLFAARPS